MRCAIFGTKIPARRIYQIQRTGVDILRRSPESATAVVNGMFRRLQILLLSGGRMFWKLAVELLRTVLSLPKMKQITLGLISLRKPLTWQLSALDCLEFREDSKLRMLKRAYPFRIRALIMFIALV